MRSSTILSIYQIFVDIYIQWCYYYIGSLGKRVYSTVIKPETLKDTGLSGLLDKCLLLG